MNNRRKLHKIFHFAGCLIVTALILGIEAKSQNASGHFVSIPAELQPQFFKHLNLFVTFQKEKRWDKMYDLSNELLEKKPLTRKEFIKNYRAVDVDPRVSALLRFSPTSATFINQWGNVKEWLIEGCATYRRKGKILHVQSGLNAALSDGKWYFSYLSSTVEGPDAPEQPCTPISKKKK
jgi:hypothetical protein